LTRILLDFLRLRKCVRGR